MTVSEIGRRHADNLLLENDQTEVDKAVSFALDDSDLADVPCSGACFGAPGCVSWLVTHRALRTVNRVALVWE